MIDIRSIGKKSTPIKVWIVLGTAITVFSAIFLVPPIYLALSGSGNATAYIGLYFIPFMMTILLFFIVLVVIYIYWHMANQTDLVEKLNSIEKKLDERSHKHSPQHPVRSDSEAGGQNGYHDQDLYRNDNVTTSYPIATTRPVFQPDPAYRNPSLNDETDDTKTDEPAPAKRKFNRNSLKYMIDMGLAVTFTTTFATGILKFPLILRAFNVSPRALPTYELSILHDYGALVMGLLILAHLLLNIGWMVRMTKKSLAGLNMKKLATRSAVISVAALLIFVTFTDPAVKRFIFGQENTITIEGIGEFEYKPGRIESVRPDIFKPGHFSVFDILVYLNQTGKIRMQYHFDDSMNTHVIDSINGRSNFWHMVYYDGGWPETNVFRMDHYPYKEKMYVRLMKEDRSFIDRVHDTFREEIIRKNANRGEIIIPGVVIRGQREVKQFLDVVVTAHDLRNDTFADGVITAIDVIMSLGDQGHITHDIGFLENIGAAEFKSYFVAGIDDDKNHGRCGFVYEEGSNDFKGFKGNHIHIPSDIRVINTPAYEEWFWICI